MNGHAATAPCSSEKLTVAIVVPAINMLKNMINCWGALRLLRYCGAFLHQDDAAALWLALIQNRSLLIGLLP